ncbi:hypothetical protein QOT17_023147 [Balamuthia mandrillaris]
MSSTGAERQKSYGSIPATLVSNFSEQQQQHHSTSACSSSSSSTLQPPQQPEEQRLLRPASINLSSTSRALSLDSTAFVSSLASHQQQQQQPPQPSAAFPSLRRLLRNSSLPPSASPSALFFPSPSSSDAEVLEEEDETVPKEAAQVAQQNSSSLGTKTIGVLSSYVFIINQIYGPGVLAIPIVFQQAGLLVSLATMALFTVLSSLASCMLCEGIARLPGNDRFQLRVEYANAVRHYFGRAWHFVFQVFLNVSLQTMNVASIIICAQSMDSFLIYLFHHSWALEIYPHPSFIGTESIDDLYKGSALHLTVGYLLVMAACIPLGIYNLDDNIKVQWLSFFGLLVLQGEFVFQFIRAFISADLIPMVGVSYAQVISVFIVSWGYVLLIPSWVNEKRTYVNVNASVWLSAIISLFGYLLLGCLAAMAYTDLETDDLLERMSSGERVLVVTRFSVYLFSLFIILPGIPVYSITTRYNLLMGGVCGKKMSYFWGVIAPWLLGFIFAQGSFFAMLLNWSALIVTGFVNFLVPFLIYYKARSQDERREKISASRSASRYLTINNNDREEGEQDVTSFGGVVENDEESRLRLLLITKKTCSVNALPLGFSRYWRPITWLLMCITLTLILTGVGVNLYYLIFLHKNLLG